jgi:hypothetical protein
MSLALDSIINRTVEDNTTVNSYGTIANEDNLLDNIALIEDETPQKNDMTSPLDDILSMDLNTNIQEKDINSMDVDEDDESSAPQSTPMDTDDLMQASTPLERVIPKPTLLKSFEPEKTHPSIVSGNVQRLNPGDVLLSNKNDFPITVVDIIPSFTHIPTYVVDFLNNRQLFKWYNKSVCGDLKKLRTELETLFKDTKCPSYVLKPTIFTKPNPSGGFGCIYANTNHSYYTLRDIINGYTIEYEYDHTPKRTKVKFKNINAIVNTAINVAKIFNDLNSKNNFFYSFYEEDLLVNIENGDVLLDISNAITRKDKEFTINKGCIYLAPELLNETTQPNQYTDSHTLAVLLFRIFFHNHPLEGKKVVSDLSLDFKNQIKYYSDEAKFIYDRNDSSNKPVRGVHFAVLSMWEKYPEYIREAFVYSLGDKLFSPEERYTPLQWLDVLLHLESDILPCVCGRVDFSFLYKLTSETFFECQKCNSQYHSIYFKKKKYRIPVYEGNKVYATFLKDNPKPYNDVIGVVQENKIHSNVFGLINVSKNSWNCTVKNGEFKTINPNSVLPIFQHFNLDYFGSIAEFDYKE